MSHPEFWLRPKFGIFRNLLTYRHLNKIPDLTEIVHE